MRSALALGSLVGLLAGCRNWEPFRLLDCDEAPESERCAEEDVDSGVDSSVAEDPVTKETDLTEPTEDAPADTSDTGEWVLLPCGTPREAGCEEPHPRLGTLRYIPPGVFTMGCLAGRDDVVDVVCDPPDPSETRREIPSRSVHLSTSVWMMESEVTQGMWTGLGFTNPSGFSGTDLPVETVNWWEALEAANEASRRDGLAECYALTGCTVRAVGDNRTCSEVTVTSESGHPKDCAGWRLPTEAEWEYAARAGTDRAFSGGPNVERVAWYRESSDVGNGAEPQPVCTTPTPRNRWGLCDMSGNVREWVWDWSVTPYDTEDTHDPVGPASGVSRANRGGSWGSNPQIVRVSRRISNLPGSRGSGLGFRLVRSVP